MATLTEIQKQFIIEKLAQFCGHAEIARQLQADFDVVVDRWQIRTYDPSHPKFAGGEKLRELFETKRSAYESAIKDIPIAHKGYRLNMLQRMLDEAMDVKNFPLASKILRQAAQEAGKIGIGSLQDAPKQSPLRDMTPDERRQAVAEMLREALSKKEAKSQLTVREAA